MAERTARMAIQFQCPGCQQPIEVDSEHAGRVAACPYCQRVVTVPPESTYRPEALAAARPTAAPLGAVAAERPFPAAEGLHVGANIRPGERAARVMGAYALLCAGLVIALFIGMLVPAVAALTNRLSLWSATQPSGSQPSPAEISEIQRDLMKDLPAHKWFLPLSCGAEVATVLGLALSIASVARLRRGNWAGITALIICACFLFCFCAGAALQFTQVGRSLAP
jgi:endogenous inhibitor of DNA gyrase (YacG/DUF329 family)